jgi:hypothetical protein
VNENLGRSMSKLIGKKLEIINDKASAEKYLNQFEGLILKPIKKILETKESHFYGFVLMSVALDNLSNIRFYGDFPCQKKVGFRYRKFIKEYMPQEYKKEIHHLYEDFRCKIVHQFQLKHYDLRQDKDSHKNHLKRKNNLIILNSTKFYDAIKKAFDKLKTEILQNDSNVALQALIKNRYNLWFHI